MEKKITKKEQYEKLLGMESVQADVELVEFIQTQIEQIEAKAEKAKERAEAKKTASDELKDTIAGLLTEDAQTAADILAQIESDDLTVAKITSRVSKLVKEGVAEKVSIKVDGKVRVAYVAVAQEAEAVMVSE